MKAWAWENPSILGRPSYKLINQVEGVGRWAMDGGRYLGSGVISCLALHMRVLRVDRGKLTADVGDDGVAEMRPSHLSIAF